MPAASAQCTALVDERRVARIVQRRRGQPEVLVERDAHDVGLPARHQLEVGGPQSFATARPLERRAIDAVKQVRPPVGGADGVAVDVVAARRHRRAWARPRSRCDRRRAAARGEPDRSPQPRRRDDEQPARAIAARSRRYLVPGSVQELQVADAEVVVGNDAGQFLWPELQARDQIRVESQRRVAPVRLPNDVRDAVTVPESSMMVVVLPSSVRSNGAVVKQSGKRETVGALNRRECDRQAGEGGRIDRELRPA